MLFTFFVFLHLMATCAAIGTIVVTDLRLAAKLMGCRVVIPRPERFKTVMVMVSLVVLYATGIMLVVVGLSERPDDLANGKMQGTLVLVGVLTLNAFILHFRTFPIHALSRPVSEWSRRQSLTVAGSVSLLRLGSRDAPRQQPDWVDSTIATLGELARKASQQRGAVRENASPPSANQQHYGCRVADRRVVGMADRRGIRA